MEEKLLDMSLGNDFLDTIPKAQATKAKIDTQKSETTLN